jgi:hypothetical protein
MTIWIVALIILGVSGLALMLASVLPLVLRRRREAGPQVGGEPVFFRRHDPPQPVPLEISSRQRKNP